MNLMDIEIRAANETDLDTIVEYNARLAEETESKDLDRNLLRSGVTALLAEPSRGRYFVAESDGTVVGQRFMWRGNCHPHRSIGRL